MKKIILSISILAFAGAVHAQTNTVIESFDFNTDGVLPSADPDVTFFVNPSGLLETDLYSAVGGFLEQRTFLDGSGQNLLTAGAYYQDWNGQLDQTQSLAIEAQIETLQVAGSFGISFQAIDGAYRYTFGLTDSGFEVLTTSGLVGFTYPLSGTHTYRIESPASSSTANLFIDGAYVTTWEGASFTTLNGFNFGDGAGAGWGDANWNYITVTQDVALTPVPEPATYAALLGLAAIGLVLIRRQRRQG